MPPAEERVAEHIKANINKTYMIRPVYIGWGIYEPLGENQANLLLTSENKNDLTEFLYEIGANYV